MRPFIVRLPVLLTLLTGRFASAMALYPFIVVRSADDRHNRGLINHERIHLHQQRELLLVVFYLWYAIEYLVRRIQYRGHARAYRNISFEREAYHAQARLQYLERRRPYAFLRFLVHRTGPR